MSKPEVDHDSTALTEHSWETLDELARARFHRWVVRQGLYREGQTVGSVIESLEKLQEETGEPDEKERFNTWIELLKKLRPTEGLSVIVSVILLKTQK